jgi:sugar phosphate isomerase/epimerase
MAVWTFRVLQYGLDKARVRFDDAGLTVRAVEAVTEWGAGPEVAVKEVEKHLDVASELGADILQAAILDPSLDFPRAVDGFAAVCERAAAQSVRVSIEFVPWFGVPDLATAWRIVQESGATNGGICLDMLHWERQPGGPNLELLREIPGERIPYVQLCDAAPTAPRSGDEYMTAALSARPLAGEGVVDIPAVLETLVAIGADPYFAFETFNTELARSGPEAMARRLRENAHTVFP